MGKPCRGIRAKWSKEDMEEALRLVGQGKSQRYAAQRCGIPRRTLRNHIKSGTPSRALGRPPVLTPKLENELEKKIVRFAERGFPLTPKSLRRVVYSFVDQQKIANKFNKDKKLAGREWYRAFLKRHHKLSQRRAQNMNPARAQKLNKHIVEDYFKKLGALFDKTGLKHSPDKLYNMDEKGCRLTLHHQQKVIAKKGAKRVHLVSQEHAENVTIVACGNAMGHVIPPMILFKGQRMKPTFSDGLPPGSAVHMTPKGSMTTEVFVKWLDHFAQFMSAPPVILIFDGASCHLDLSIVEKAEQLGIHLLCLPSNTTHELQPMDKAVFRSFEHYWDEELLQYWENYPGRNLNKERFSDIFTPVWGRSMTINNICSGFRATGIFPFNKNIIPDYGYAPSLPTNKEIPNVNRQIPDVSRESRQVEEWESEDDQPLSLLKTKIRGQNEAGTNSFSTVLVTPNTESSKRATVRKKALNYKAQEVTRDLFHDRNDTGKSSKAIQSKQKTRICESEPTPSTSRDLFQNEDDTQKSSNESCIKQNTKICEPELIPSTSRGKVEESWFCKLCETHCISDMRQCIMCLTWVHEDCVGLTAEDEDDFVCPDCTP